MPDELNTELDLYVSMLIAKMVHLNFPIHIYGVNSKMFEHDDFKLEYKAHAEDDVDDAFKLYYFTIVFENIDYFKKACENNTKCLFYSRQVDLGNIYGYDNVIQLYGDADEDISTISHIINNVHQYKDFNSIIISKPTIL